MAVDLSVFSRLKTKADFDRENEAWQLEKQAKQAQLRKQDEFDLDKMGEQVLLKAAMGGGLTPEEEAIGRAYDAKRNESYVDPVSGNLINKPPAFGGLYGGKVNNNPASLLDISSASDIEGMIGQQPSNQTGVVPGAPGVSSLGDTKKNKMLELDALEQTELARAGDNRKLAADIQKFYAEKRMNQLAGTALPPAALKIQTELHQGVNSIKSVNADLAQLKTNVDGGGINLGLINNIVSRARNFTGNSTESSRGYETLVNNLERLRNESLRLNKGVQTEGDAQRAWNELIRNLSDPVLVSQRLDEIMKLNERAAMYKQNEADMVRANFGADPIDLLSQEAPTSVTPILPQNQINADAIDEELRRRGVIQ